MAPKLPKSKYYQIVDKAIGFTIERAKQKGRIIAPWLKAHQNMRCPSSEPKVIHAHVYAVVYLEQQVILAEKLETAQRNLRQVMDDLGGPEHRVFWEKFDCYFKKIETTEEHDEPYDYIETFMELLDFLFMAAKGRTVVEEGLDVAKIAHVFNQAFYMPCCFVCHKYYPEDGEFSAYHWIECLHDRVEKLKSSEKFVDSLRILKNAIVNAEEGVNVFDKELDPAHILEVVRNSEKEKRAEEDKTKKDKPINTTKKATVPEDDNKRRAAISDPNQPSTSKMGTTVPEDDKNRRAAISDPNQPSTSKMGTMVREDDKKRRVAVDKQNKPSTSEMGTMTREEVEERRVCTGKQNKPSTSEMRTMVREDGKKRRAAMGNQNDPGPSRTEAMVREENKKRRAAISDPNQPSTSKMGTMVREDDKKRRVAMGDQIDPGPSKTKAMVREDDKKRRAAIGDQNDPGPSRTEAMVREDDKKRRVAMGDQIDPGPSKTKAMVREDDKKRRATMGWQNEPGTSKMGVMVREEVEEHRPPVKIKIRKTGESTMEVVLPDDNKTPSPVESKKRKAKGSKKERVAQEDDGKHRSSKHKKNKSKSSKKLKAMAEQDDDAECHVDLNNGHEPEPPNNMAIAEEMNNEHSRNSEQEPQITNIVVRVDEYGERRALMIDKQRAPESNRNDQPNHMNIYNEHPSQGAITGAKNHEVDTARPKTIYQEAVPQGAKMVPIVEDDEIDDPDNFRLVIDEQYDPEKTNNTIMIGANNGAMHQGHMANDVQIGPVAQKRGLMVYPEYGPTPHESVADDEPLDLSMPSAKRARLNVVPQPWPQDERLAAAQALLAIKYS